MSFLALPPSDAARSGLQQACARPLAGAVAAVALALTAALPLPASAADSLVRFEGGIGSQPLRSGGTPNVVHGLNPGGVPWVISRLRADVQTDGRIRVDGRGLLLAGGNGIGTSGGQTVHAELFCGASVFRSPATPLDEKGDFRIDGTLALNTSQCATPALLIVNETGAWFAAGILER